MKAVGDRCADASSTEDLQSMDQLISTNGFICSNKIKRHSNKFYNSQAVLCGNGIETNYYNPTTGTKRGRIITEDICAICYVGNDIVSINEMRANMHLAGKTPLTICRGFYDVGIKSPLSSARKNLRQVEAQIKISKKRQMNEAVSRGCRKAPRRS
eukprot:14105086-Ditylum_brightwellii.AAC.1